MKNHVAAIRRSCSPFMALFLPLSLLAAFKQTPSWMRVLKRRLTSLAISFGYVPVQFFYFVIFFIVRFSQVSLQCMYIERNSVKIVLLIDCRVMSLVYAIIFVFMFWIMLLVD